MSKSKATAPMSTQVRKPEPTAKGPRSDRLGRRERADLSKPESIPYHLRGAIPGQVDRGLKTSAFVVVTRSNKTGEIITTRHLTNKLALRAAKGRESHHTVIRVYFDDKAPMPEEIKAMATFDDGGPYNEPNVEQSFDRELAASYGVGF